MARQTYYLDRAVKHPLYPTRMLQAGPLDLDASAARLYRKLGVELSDEAPKRAAKVEAPAPVEEPAPEPAPEAPKPAAKKAAPKRRKATAKKAK